MSLATNDRMEHLVHTQLQKRANTAHTRSIRSSRTPKNVFASIVDKDPVRPTVSAEDIRLCAYRKWVCAGKPIGDGIEFWLEAEQELVQGQ